MPFVLKSDERKFWKGLCKLFQKLIDDTRAGSGLLNGQNDRVRMFLHTPEINNYINRIIGKMAHTQRMRSAASWREAASKSTNGAEINRLIRHEMSGPVGTAFWNIVNDNSAYIKSLPDIWAKFASQYAARMTLNGERPEAVEAKLRQVIPEHMQKNLKTIARTECAKANAALVQARAEMCGIKAYIWRCVKDERSRDSHIHMDRVLVFYDDPPSPEALIGEKAYGRYHAGNTFNCRCYQQPVLDISFLPDTITVYKGGRIFTTTKGNIIRKYGMIT